MPTPKSSKVITFIKFAIGIGAVIFFLLWLDIDETLKILSRIDLIAVVILFFNYVFDRLFMAYKWGLLIKSFNKKISFWSLSKAYFYGSFATQFMPISISGDAVRFYFVYESGVSKTHLFSSMVIEKIFGFLSLVIVVVISIILYSEPLSNNNNLTKFVFTFLILLGVLVLFLFLIFKTRISSSFLKKYKGKFKRKILKVISSFRFFLTKKEVLIKFFVLSIIEQVFPLIGIYIICHSLGINITLLQVLFVQSVTLLLARLPISPSAIGVQEGAFVGLFILIGIKGEFGFAVSITSRILDVIFPLPFVLIYFSEAIKTLKKSKNKKSAELM